MKINEIITLKDDETLEERTLLNFFKHKRVKKPKPEKMKKSVYGGVGYYLNYPFSNGENSGSGSGDGGGDGGGGGE